MNSNRDIIPKGYNLGQVSNFSPEQQKLFGEQFGRLGPESYLSKLAGGDQETYDQLEAPAYRQFNQNLGNIASRFSAQGTGGRHSSGFKNSTSSVASNFAQDLSANRVQLRQQAMKDLFEMSNQLLGQRQSERALFEKPQKQLSGWEQAGIGFAGGAGQAAGKYLTGKLL